MKLWVYKSDLTAHWIVDRYGPKPRPQFEVMGNGLVRLYPAPNGHGRQGFRTAEGAWAHVAETVDEYCAMRKEIEKLRVTSIAQDRELYPWLYENEGDE